MPPTPDPASVGRTARDDIASLARTRTPWRFGSLELPHRVVLGSMHTGQEADPSPDGLVAFYRERVEGGAALVVTGGLAVNGAGRGLADYAVLTDPAVVERWTAVTEAVHAAGGRIAAQLFHAGRYALLDGVLGADGTLEVAVAPSPVPWRAARGAVPRELTHDEVLATVADFAAAARCAVDAGFDAVEVMASEGYLLNQFASPLTNLRDDAWGGDARRRRRFPVEVVRAVRAAVDVPVGVRVSGDDLMPGSSTPDEVDALVRALVGTPEEPGADAVSVGVGWHESRVPTVQAVVPHGAWLPVAERVAAAVRSSARPDVPVVASNRFTDLRDVEAVLRRGTVDAVALARPFLADPAIVAKSLAGRFDLVTTCLGCDQACIDRSLVGGRVSCLVNPRAGFESVHPLPWPVTAVLGPAAGRGASPSPVDGRVADGPVPDGRVAEGRRLAVVGGGPAGLAAALDAARRGIGVTLFEASDAVGGQLALAARIPGKEDYAAAVAAAHAELVALGADVRLGRRAVLADLVGGEVCPDATGSSDQGDPSARAGRSDGAGRSSSGDADHADRGEHAGHAGAATSGATGPFGRLPFDAVVLASGVRPRRIDGAGRGEAPGAPGAAPARDAPAAAGGAVEGADLPHVLDYETALRAGVPDGPVALVGGGGIGVDVATYLVEEHAEADRAPAFARRAGVAAEGLLVGDREQRRPAPAPALRPGMRPRPGEQVTLLRRSGRFGAGIGVTSRWVALGTLREAGVQMLGGVTYTRIVPGAVEVVDADGVPRSVAASTVVVCAGQEPVRDLADGLAASGVPFEVVGGARDARSVDAVRATAEGLAAVRRLLPDRRPVPEHEATAPRDAAGARGA